MARAGGHLPGQVRIGMRFLLDMGISPDVVSFLRSRGADASHLNDEGLARLDDHAILTKARNEGRVLVTHDLDFGELLAAAGAELPSVLLFRLRNMRPNAVNHYLQEILDHHADELVRGAIMVITETQIRVRSLPLGDQEK